MGGMSIQVRVFIAVLAAQATAGCTLSRSLQLAEPVGRGNAEVSFEAGVTPDLAPIGQQRFAPTGDLAVRYGLDDDVDFTFRTGSSGYEGGLKRAFAVPGAPRLKFAGEARLSMAHPGVAPPLIGATGGAVIQWSPLQSVHLLVAPRVSAHALPTESEVLHSREEGSSSLDLGTINSSILVLPVTSLGLAVDVHPQVRLAAEATALLHPEFVQAAARMGALPLTGSFAVQWRPR